MKRSILQVYVKDSKKAVNIYLEAFEGEVVSEFLNDSGGYYHCEIKIDDVILAISEVENITEHKDINCMQFCFHYKNNEIEKIKKAYSVLGQNALIHFPLGETDYATLMVDLTDQFGVRWCLFG